MLKKDEKEKQNFINLLLNKKRAIRKRVPGNLQSE